MLALFYPTCIAAVVTSCSSLAFCAFSVSLIAFYNDSTLTGLLSETQHFAEQRLSLVLLLTMVRYFANSYSGYWFEVAVSKRNHKFSCGITIVNVFFQAALKRKLRVASAVTASGLML